MLVSGGALKAMSAWRGPGKLLVPERAQANSVPERSIRQCHGGALGNVSLERSTAMLVPRGAFRHAIVPRYISNARFLRGALGNVSFWEALGKC
ncbi:hypothetical protein AVEN_88980-1 [Araneus ventricosus]|uniref:Uncharacterized protein n=1 Tax=Araneus ventricosus TaxID=182803 RepID=A0A4Y2DIN2_ARAVE|nr:hypothetical protein AVEN_88980-1 [Araneus ventricosus]